MRRCKCCGGETTANLLVWRCGFCGSRQWWGGEDEPIRLERDGCAVCGAFGKDCCKLHQEPNAWVVS